LKSLFDGIVDVDIKDETVINMKSKEKEEILLTKPVKCTSKIEVERWLDSLTTEMKVTVRKILQTGQKEYTEEGRKDWVLKHGGQVVAAVA